MANAVRQDGSWRRAFDEHHPPDPELIADCVHCGFCLPTCPTYLLWGEEMDSPRGRIQLMKMASKGEIGMTGHFVRHMDQCLGCMACVTACPSGVQYNKLIEATRPQVERRFDRRAGDRIFRSALFKLFPYPRRLRALLPLLLMYQRTGMTRLVDSSLGQRVIPHRLRGMAAILPTVHLGRKDPPHATTDQAARGDNTPRHRAGVVLGCIQRVFFADVNAATVRVLAAEGCEVVVPQTQGCCGALSFHAGREDEGLTDAFERAPVDTIVVNVAGCGSTLKEYGYLLRDDANYAERAAAFSSRVRDVTELLAELESVAHHHPISARVAYHDACHLAHGQGVRKQPRALLRSIPELDVVDIPEGEICCGSAGVYNLLEPTAATELGERKARNILSTHPDALVAANPGCLLQISASLKTQGRSLPTLHPVELLDASIRGAVPPGLEAAHRQSDQVARSS
jgi:glycolate oxidase iron-sulfur subunit